MLFTRRTSLLAVCVLSALEFSNSLKDYVNSGILVTGEVILNTTNKLFSILQHKRKNLRLSQDTINYKHFASTTLQDDDSLSEIARSSRAGTGSKTSERFTAAINESLKDGHYSVDESFIKNTVVTEKIDDYVVDTNVTFQKSIKQDNELLDTNSYVKINNNTFNVHEENTTKVNQQDDHYRAIDIESEEMQFWKPSGRRIYGGRRTKIKHFPFLASIQMFDNFQCAGSIIKTDLVITASSCLQLAWNNRFFRENPAFLSVRIGSSFYTGGGEIIPVLEVYFHPGYDPKTLRNNICILRLVRKIRFRWRTRRRVRKINIDRHADGIPFNTPAITILGWGAKGRSNVVRDPWSNILSYALLDVYPLRDCQDVYSKDYVTHKNFCAGFISKGGGACNHDVGGPGIDGGTLVGVVSFGSPLCGAPDAPTVFTKLGYYADWIDSVMEQEVPFTKVKTFYRPKSSLVLTTLKPFKSTTFKVPSRTGKMKPDSIIEIQNILQIFDNDLYREFLKTIFESKEMAEYQDIFKEVEQDVASKVQGGGKQVLRDEMKVLQNKKKLKSEVPRNIRPSYVEFDDKSVTKLVEVGPKTVETATIFDNYSKYTLVGDKLVTKSKNRVNKNSGNIAELIKKIDLRKIIEEETIAVKKKNKKNATESILSDEMSPLEVNKNNESILTLLYLSEENKKQNKPVEESEDEGLSIATDSFQDLTRSKNKNTGGDAVTDEELYEILSEVIDDEIRNDKTIL